MLPVPAPTMVPPEPDDPLVPPEPPEPELPAVPAPSPSSEPLQQTDANDTSSAVAETFASARKDFDAGVIFDTSSVTGTDLRRRKRRRQPATLRKTSIGLSSTEVARRVPRSFAPTLPWGASGATTHRSWQISTSADGVCLADERGSIGVWTFRRVLREPGGTGERNDAHGAPSDGQADAECPTFHEKSALGGRADAQAPHRAKGPALREVEPDIERVLFNEESRGRVDGSVGPQAH